MKQLFQPGAAHPNFKHGLSRHPARQALIHAQERCSNPKNARYECYGARGITVCQAWLDDFMVFWAEMGPSWVPGLTLDRINNDGNYEAGNCRWATAKQQAQNRSNSISVDTPWGTLNLADVALKIGVSHAALHQRYKKGWRGEKLLAPPNPSKQRKRLSATAA